MLTVETMLLPKPMLEFGPGEEATDPKVGLERSGPFSLRFGTAHKSHVSVGLVGPESMFSSAVAWFRRCQSPIQSGQANREMYPNFPGFHEVFRSTLDLNSRWQAKIKPKDLRDALELMPRNRFEVVLQLYELGIKSLATLEVRPDVVVCCLPDDVVTRCWSIENHVLGRSERSWLKWRRESEAKGQLLLFDGRPVEETGEDLLFRDFRRALKARAMKYRMPVQIGTLNLFADGEKNQDAATRAWNVCLALFYKSRGIPWRLASSGPETCFVGISFHHLRTQSRHLVYSSLAQAFSNEGDGFALRGEAIPWNENNRRVPHLSEEQAGGLVTKVLREYQDRTGQLPERVVLHKTSLFDEAEGIGFRTALRQIPIVELVNIMPTRFRLMHRGTYPPARGTLCQVNRSAAYLYTTGFIPEWRTYPGPHIPAPIQLRTDKDSDVQRIALDILALGRVNWNTARDTSGVPITLRFARHVGGIMSEVGTDAVPESSYRYYM
jgi:hypothetical protein